MAFKFISHLGEEKEKEVGLLLSHGDLTLWYFVQPTVKESGSQISRACLLSPKGTDFPFSFSFLVFDASLSSGSGAEADRLGKAILNLKVT